MVREIMLESVDLDFPGTAFCVYKFFKSSTQYSDVEKDVLIFHHHLYYEFHFLTKGSYDFVTLAKIIKISQGELLIIPPGIRHYAFQKSAETEEICLCLTVEQKTEEEGFYEYFKNSLDDAALLPIKASEALMENFASFGNISSEVSIRNYCYMKRMVCDILVDLFDMMNGFDYRSAKSLPPKHKEHVNFLLENYVNNPKYTLADIADNLHYSERQVARMIQDTYGSSLYDLRNSRKTEIARLYLDKGNSIQKASELAGFKSVETFRRCFKKYVGTMPSDYKKEHRKNDGKSK